MSSHLERELRRFGEGAATAAEYRRLTEHARTCPSCAARFERLALATRALEAGSPWAPAEDELALVAEAGLGAALAAARSRPAKDRSWLFALAGMATASAAAIALSVWTPPDEELTARGGRPSPGAVFRTFCAREGAALVELGPGAACPARASLAFAASAQAPLAFVAVRVRAQDGAELREGPFPVGGRPGAEAALPATPRLALAPGPAEVVAAFASTAAAASEALQHDESEGAVRLRLTFRVEEAR